MGLEAKADDNASSSRSQDDNLVSVSGRVEAATERGAMAVPDELTDAKIAAAEARTDAKLARFEGKLDVIHADLRRSLSSLNDNVAAQRSEAASNRNTLVATVIGTGIAVIGALVAMLGYGAATFYNGTVLRDAVTVRSSSTG